MTTGVGAGAPLPAQTGVEPANGAESRLTDDGEENYGYGVYYGNWKASSIPRTRRGTPSPP